MPMPTQAEQQKQIVDLLKKAIRRAKHGMMTGVIIVEQEGEEFYTDVAMEQNSAIDGAAKLLIGLLMHVHGADYVKALMEICQPERGTEH